MGIFGSFCSSTNCRSIFAASETSGTMYDFTAKLNNGEEISLKKYVGHPCVVVNVASNWGLATSEYKALNQLYSDFANRENGLRILAFPCNQFGNQEPGTDAEIKTFVDGKGFQGDLFHKIDVNGKDAIPFFQWLKKQKNGRGTLGDDIKWNYTKFLIDQKGKVVCRLGPATNSSALAPRIKELFAASAPA